MDNVKSLKDSRHSIYMCENGIDIACGIRYICVRMASISPVVARVRNCKYVATGLFP